MRRRETRNTIALQVWVYEVSAGKVLVRAGEVSQTAAQLLRNEYSAPQNTRCALRKRKSDSLSVQRHIWYDGNLSTDMHMTKADTPVLGKLGPGQKKLGTINKLEFSCKESSHSHTFTLNIWPSSGRPKMTKIYHMIW